MTLPKVDAPQRFCDSNQQPSRTCLPPLQCLQPWSFTRSQSPRILSRPSSPIYQLWRRQRQTSARSRTNSSRCSCAIRSSQNRCWERRKPFARGFNTFHTKSNVMKLAWAMCSWRVRTFWMKRSQGNRWLLSVMMLRRHIAPRAAPTVIRILIPVLRLPRLPRHRRRLLQPPNRQRLLGGQPRWHVAINIRTSARSSSPTNAGQ